MARPLPLGTALAVLLAAVFGACDGGSSATDAATDASQDDGGGDTAPLACDFPAPAMGASAAAAALAAAPEQCGQAPFTWLDDPSLGDVIAVEAAVGFRAGSLRDAAAAEGIELPRDPIYDTAVRTISYRTQDRGAFVEATAMVAYPFEPADGRTDFDILLLLHGTSGFTDGCGISDLDEYHILGALFASLGFAVVAPDFIGLKSLGDPTGFPHPYLVGQATALASLDAVRALAKLTPGRRGETCARPRVVAFGGSQGGHAALWVDRLAPYYAGEFELRGTIATVPPSDILGQVFPALTSVIDATANTIALLSLAGPWYGLEDRLDEIFVPPLDVDIPAALAGSCDPEDAVGTYDTLEEVFQPALLAAAAAGTLADFGEWGCLLTESGLTTTTIERPAPTAPGYGILFVLAELDELVDPAVERAAFATLCAQGLRMEYLECAGADHVDGTYWAIPEIVDFAEARMAGEPFDASTVCEVQPAARCRGTP